MVMERVTRLVCDRCGKTGPEALPGEISRVLAQDAGWGILVAGEDLCPACLAKLEPVGAGKEA